METNSENDLLNYLLLYSRTVLVHNLISMTYYSIFTIITIEILDVILALSFF